MATYTITEALADVKTLGKRLEKKREFVGAHVARNDVIRDPFEKDGGSAVAVQKEVQAMADLEARLVNIRLAIQDANHRIQVTVGGETRSIAAWLAWRKEVAPARQGFLKKLRDTLAQIRKDAQRQGITVGAAVSQAIVQNGQPVPQNIVVNIDELALSKDMEALEQVLGDLDGQLSLKNATELVTVAD